MFDNLNLGAKLTIAFLAVGLIPFGLVGGVSLYKSGKAMEKQAYGSLESVREIKKTQVEDFFAAKKADMGVLMETVQNLRDAGFAKLSTAQELKRTSVIEYIEGMKSQMHILCGDPYTMDALIEMDTILEAFDNDMKSPEYLGTVKRYDDRMQAMMKANGWYDLLLIRKNGDIIYSAAKGADLGLNILNSEIKESSLGKAFQKVKSQNENSIAIGDFEAYAPSDGKPAAFMVAKMVNQMKELQGYVAFRVPTEKINKIMQQRSGMGVSGESYLVGKIGDQVSFRSNMTTMGDGKYVVGYSISTAYIEEALNGNSGQGVFSDSTGKLVMVAYDPLQIDGFSWAAVSKIDLKEAIANAMDSETTDYFTKYVKQLGYYDLFLIHPKGDVFYSVAKEPDYGTNMVNGKYADSGLGRLTRKVLETKQFSFVDFAPYAPSNGVPAAFMAQPVVHDNQAELVVALQLSQDAINKIMTQRQGMGLTGETYLVGPDKLMRSDSFRDKANHSVAASFANPATGSVDTPGAIEALAGNSGESVFPNYMGEQVLCAYAPIRFGDTTWALMAEIGKDEAFASSKAIMRLIGIIAALTFVAVIIVALLITRYITRPINRAIDGLNEGSEQVSSASCQVSSASQSLAEGASQQAAALEETSSSLEEMASMTRQNADNAAQANVLMKESQIMVARAIASMDDLTTSIKEISQASDETSKIVRTIDEIAFQTNLLALNAAVEAARAGEAGAGFSVVAGEVRNLSMRAAEAAKNTAFLIEGTVNKVTEGASLADQANEAFEEMAVSSSKVGSLLGEIAEASGDQAQGIDQVNKAVGEMDKVTQQNAASAEESASASEEMNAQAMQMKEIVEDLIVIVSGAKNSSLKNSKKDSVTTTSASTVRLNPPPVAKKEKKNTPPSIPIVSPDQVIPMDDEDFTDF